MTKSRNNNAFLPQKLDASLLTCLQQQGKSERYIVNELAKRGIKTSKSTVHRRLHAHVSKGGGISKYAQKSRKKLDDRAVRRLIKQLRFDKQVTTKQIHKLAVQLGYHVSYRTVLRRLHTVPSLKMRRPKRVVQLLPSHRAARRAWAKECLQAKIDWTKVWFADEKIWYIDGPTYRPKVWQDDRGPLAEIPGKGGRNTAVWVFGAISMNGLSKLVVVRPHFNSTEYCQTLEEAILQSNRSHTYVLYHDRYPPHTSRQTQTWMAQHNFQNVILPPKSPDLNPIENVWGIISREIFEGLKTYNSVESLVAAVQAAWDRVQLDSRLRRRLVGSMPERLRAVTAAKGRKTKF